MKRAINVSKWFIRSKGFSEPENYYPKIHKKRKKEEKKTNKNR